MNGDEYRPRRKRFLIWPLLIAGVVAAFQYFSSQKYVNPETGRSARVALSEAQESSLGLQSYQEVLSQSQAVTSGPEFEMVQKVMRRLIDATGDTLPFSQISWTSTGTGDAPPEAFPGGAFSGTGGAQTLGTVAANQWAESCWGFQYLNTRVAPGGTYTGRVIYTLTAP